MRTETALSRRDFLAASSAAAMTVGFGSTAQTAISAESEVPRKPLRVAAINSVYWLRSHAYHICGRMIHGYTWNGVHHQPNLQLVRMYNDQSPANDIGPRICQQHGIELAPTPEAALGGLNGLDVDAVAIIVEHGNYPVNERDQVLYPRYEMFQRVVEVFKESGRSVPIFIDKHLSYNHQRAAEMVQTAKKMGFGLSAGSSLPVTWRVPSVEVPLETPFIEGLVTYGFDRGAIDIYLFHALESLQVFMERRQGGETGVKSVQMLRGEAVWKAADEGRWSWSLMEESLKHCQSLNVGPVKVNVSDPLAVLIEYNDGTKGTVLNLIEQTSEFGFAGKISGLERPLTCNLYLPSPPAANFFNPLTYHIEQFFLNGKPSYPVERTLLTSTLCDLALQSLHEGQRVVTAPALEVRYAAPTSSGFARGEWTNLLRGN